MAITWLSSALPDELMAVLILAFNIFSSGVRMQCTEKTLYRHDGIMIFHMNVNPTSTNICMRTFLYTI